MCNFCALCSFWCLLCKRFGEDLVKKIFFRLFFDTSRNKFCNFTSGWSLSEEKMPRMMWGCSAVTGLYFLTTASPRVTDWPATTNLSNTSKHHRFPSLTTSLSTASLQNYLLLTFAIFAFHLWHFANRRDPCLNVHFWQRNEIKSVLSPEIER